MIADTPTLTRRPAWRSLAAHQEQLRAVHLRQLSADDPDRGARLTAAGAGPDLDYSKHRVTAETLLLLLQLAAERELPGRIEAMFRGDKVNVTERRAGDPPPQHDSSTDSLIRRYRAHREAGS